MISTGGRQRRCEVVRNALGSVGYSEAHVQFDWQVSDHEKLQEFARDSDPGNLPTGTPTRLDVVAFYDERERNWDTTALVAELDRLDLIQNKSEGRNRARQLFELTAAPCALFAGNGTADLWLKCWREPEPVRDIPFDEDSLRRRFRRHRRDVEREALARLRGGQRFLFDGVYHARREELVHFLHRGLSKATWLAPVLAEEKLKKEYEPERKALSRVAIALMAARILEDKGFFGPREQSTDARQILEDAEHEANGFFQAAIRGDLTTLSTRLDSQLVREMLRSLMAHLTGPASFSMVTPEALGFLYETALTAERRRGEDVKLNGIHYTPRSIAKHIVDRIPMEEFRPSERYILDLASGSGSFLLSATERLRGIFDVREEGSEPDVLEHLRTHVIGNDIDPIAPLVTRLAYLLEHWTRTNEKKHVPEPRRLEERDALELSQDDFPDAPLTAIVGNPPFGATEHGQQLANRFMAKSLDLLSPGGYLGIVMPGPFLKQRRDQSKPIRKRLLVECELVEVWELPLQTIGLSARQETSVIIARKRLSAGRRQDPALFKSTYSSKGPALRALREHLRSTFTFAATGVPGQPSTYWLDDVMHRILASPVDRIWRKMDVKRNVGTLCETALGIKTVLGRAKFSPRPAQGYRPYLRQQGRIAPYFLLEEHWHDDRHPERSYVDPTSAHRAKQALWHLYEQRKIVLTNNTNRNADCQLRAALDENAVFPDGDIACLVLRERTFIGDAWAKELVKRYDERVALLWLVAILNSPVVNAWIASTAPPRAIPEEVRTSIPLPAVLNPLIPRLVEKTLSAPRSGRTEFELWQAIPDPNASSRGTSFEELVAQINLLVLESYGLSRKDGRLLQKYLQGMTDPWIEGPENAHLPAPGATYRRITGRVISVDVKRQRMTLDLPRYSKKAEGPVRVPLPKHIPGWALREGAEFTCLAPTNKRDPSDLQDPWLLREFRPLLYSYMEPSEIEEMAGFQRLEATT